RAEGIDDDLRTAELAEAARDLEALRAARAGDAVSEREVRVALARRDVAAAGETAAAARIEALDADAALLELRVSDTVVRAPFDGVVVERLAEVGEWVSPGDPVVRVVSTATVEIWLDVPERLLAGVGASDGRFEARVPSSDLRVPLEDARVLPLVDRASRTFRVVGRSAGAGLAPGMSVEAEVPTGERAPWTLVPKDALKYRPTGIVVAVVKGSDEGAATVTGPAVDLPVEIAFELAGEVALRPGAVQPGDVVVVEGNERLFPGAPVLATIEPGAPAEGNGR
ncbi:MAG: efflux RND transporter periplasmic adaptor subunit, partial [Planctomycetota bacterium]